MYCTSAGTENYVRADNTSPYMCTYLYVSLWLHESSHDSKAGVELSTDRVSGHAGNDGVIGTLARGETVGVARVKGEISTSILYRHAYIVQCHNSFQHML